MTIRGSTSCTRNRKAAELVVVNSARAGANLVAVLPDHLRRGAVRDYGSGVVKSGDQLGHYRIVEPLGKGGMGEVYLANDLKLDRQVALKLLPDEYVAEPERRERFLREAKAVAALSHPNIVVIHSVEEDSDHVFLTMELVQGAPLSHLIAGGPMPLGQLFDTAIPLADAISAAHQKGIAHRDLKPDNVMVTPSGHVKVLDFGLAKLLRDDDSELAAAATEMVTEEGKILGTVAYMSPEQAQGKVVDARSDIFSLGILLYEMATGRRPFDGDSKISILSSLIKDAPVPATEVNRSLPRHLGRIIKHCLEKSPDRRYQSALDIRNELESLREEIRSGEVDLPTGEHVLSAPDSLVTSQTSASSDGSLSGAAVSMSTPGVTSELTSAPGTETADAHRGWLVPAAATLAVAVALVLGWVALRSDAPADVAVLEVAGDSRPSLAVLPFVNTGEAENLAWLTDGVAEMLVTDLSQAAGIRVVGGERVREILDDLGRDAESLASLDVVRAVAARAGTAVVIAGSFVQAGEQLRVSARIIDATTGEVTGGENIDGTGEGSIFATVDALSRWIRDSVDTSTAGASAPIDRDLVDVTTDSVEAFRFYTEGVKRQDRSEYVQAIEFFEEAVRLDPEFALAYVKLSTTHGNLFQFQARDDYAERALELADRLSERERYYLQGAYYGTRTETNDRAIEGYEKALELYPDDTASRNNLALQLGEAHRHEEASAEFEETIRRGTTFGGTYTNVVITYLRLGRVADAERAARRVIDLEGLSAAAKGSWAGVLLGTGRIDEARRFVATERLPVEGIWSLQARGRLAVLLEDWEDLERVGQEAEEAGLPEWAHAFFTAVGLVYQGRVSAAIVLSDRVAGGAFAGPFDLGAAAAILLVAQGDPESALEKAFVARERAQSLQAELDAVAVAALARAVLGRSAGVEALVQDHAELAARGAGGHEERSHLLLRGQVALAGGEPRQAITFLEQAAALLEAPLLCCTNHAVVWSALGRAHLELDDTGEAERWFRKVTELGDARVADPINFIRSFYFLGTARAASGNEAGARESYERFLSYWEDGDIDRDRVAEARAYVDGA